MDQEDIFFINNSSSSNLDIFEEIYQELENKKFGYLYKTNSLFSELFVNLFRDFKGDDINKYSNLTSPTVNSLSFILSGHISENYKVITLKKLAKYYNLSERSVQRHLKNLHNTAFRDRLNVVRIEVAKDLLITSTLSPTDISREVGYKSASYFQTVFKKLEGISPKEYRDNSK